MNTTTLASVAALIIGFGGGYFFATNGTPPTTHVMPDGTSMSDTMAGMTSGLEGKIGDEFDKAFASEMIVHHEGAVAMAKLALSQAKHAEIKKMSQEIIDAQTKEIATMRGWLQDWYGISQ